MSPRLECVPRDLSLDDAGGGTSGITTLHGEGAHSPHGASLPTPRNLRSLGVRDGRGVDRHSHNSERSLSDEQPAKVPRDWDDSFASTQRDRPDRPVVVPGHSAVRTSRTKSPWSPCPGLPGSAPPFTPFLPALLEPSGSLHALCCRDGPLLRVPALSDEMTYFIAYAISRQTLKPFSSCCQRYCSTHDTGPLRRCPYPYGKRVAI
jgi:hypothetical protein